MPAPAIPQERYFVAATGTSQTASSDVRLRIPGADVTFRKVRWGIRPEEPTPYYVLQYGQFVAPRVAFQLDLTHNKAVADPRQVVGATGNWKGTPVPGTTALSPYLQKLRYTNGLNTFGFLLLYRGAGPESRWQPTIALGPHYTLIWSRNVADFQENDAKYRGTGFGWQVQTGMRYRLSSALSLMAELKYTDTPGQAVTAQNGRIDTRLRSLHETLGIVWRL